MIVLDTNIFVSYILRRSSLLGQRVAQTLQAYPYAFSEETMRELSEVIFRPKFDPYIAQEARLRILKGLAKEARWFAPSKEIIRCRDAADNRFLELAIAAQAEFLITGDQDLLILGQIQSTRICTLTEFADLRLTTL